VASNVTSFSRPPGATAPATYRFDRLPSQQAQEATQLELEAMAEMAMARRFAAAAFAGTPGMTSATDWRRQPTTRRPHRGLTDRRRILDLVPSVK
jgi:hypothetical protein